MRPDALGPRLLVLQATGQVEGVQPAAAEFANVPRQVVVPVNSKQIVKQIFLLKPFEKKVKESSFLVPLFSRLSVCSHVHSLSFTHSF